jgi:hypothetical protein
MLASILQWEQCYLSYLDPPSGNFSRNPEAAYPEMIRLAWRILFGDHVTIMRRQLTWQQMHEFPVRDWARKDLKKLSYFLLSVLDSVHDENMKPQYFTSESNHYGKL